MPNLQNYYPLRVPAVYQDVVFGGFNVAIRGMLRWLGRVWTLTHEHVEVCQRRGEREEEEEEEEEGDEGGEQKIVSAAHRAIQEVRRE